MMTPWNQMQQMHQLQSTMMQEQKKMIMKEKGVHIVKFFFINEEENRRVKVVEGTDYKGLFEYMKHFLAPYHVQKGVRINSMQYCDEENEWLNFNTDEEWQEIIRMTDKNNKPSVRIRVYTVKPESKPEEEEEENEGELEIVRTPRPKEKQEISNPADDKLPPLPEILPLPPFKEEPVPPLIQPQPIEPVRIEPIPAPIIAPTHPVVMQTNEPNKEVLKPAQPTHNHRCDICKKIPIIGKMFTSTNRKDFDLCEGCFNIRQNYGLHNEEFDVYLQPGRKIGHVGPLVKKKEEEPVKPAENPYKKELMVLRDMGFHDNDKSLKFLKKFNGDIQAVVREYLQNFN